MKKLQKVMCVAVLLCVYNIDLKAQIDEADENRIIEEVIDEKAIFKQDDPYIIVEYSAEPDGGMDKFKQNVMSMRLKIILRT